MCVVGTEGISIIIPVYNVERFLHKCINSVISQTFGNIEIILVDDGSTDSSGNICDEYAKVDDRIIVIHKENGGLSSARNAGLDVATQPLIGFVDSDDYISEDMYSQLYSLMKKEKADIVYCKRAIVCDNVVPEYTDTENIEVWHSIQALEKMFCPGFAGMAVVAWNKLYRREIFDDIRYPEGKIYEDNYIIHRVYDAADKVVFYDKTLYFYNERNDSIMRKPYSINSLHKLEGIIDRIIYSKDKVSEELFARIIAEYFYYVKIHFKMVHLEFPNEKDVIRNMCSQYRKIWLSNIRYFAKIGKKNFIKSIVFCVIPTIGERTYENGEWL